MATKTIIIKRQEFMKALTNLCNATDLPAFVLLEVLERLTTQVGKLAESELKRDTDNYLRELAKEKKESEAASNAQDERKEGMSLHLNG